MASDAGDRPMRARLDHVDEFLADALPELIALRRHLHQHPELSHAEYATTALVADRLVAAGLQPTVLKAGTGVICDIGERGRGPIVALRAELDGLRLQDEKAVPYRSTVPGAAHACGHDLHIAVLLGVAQYLSSAPTSGSLPPGTVRLIFQPAEEVIPGGALRVIDEGGLEGVDCIFGLHADPNLSVGTVGVKAGPITSGADLVEVRLNGPGGHTARPQATVDLIGLAAGVIQELPSRLQALGDDGTPPYNLVFGVIRSGTTPNVIPARADLSGILRSAERHHWRDGPTAVRSILDRVVGPTLADYELTMTRGFPPVDNDPTATELVLEAARAVLGADAAQTVHQSPGGDDFGWYTEHVRGCYVRLGVCGEGPCADIHAPLFDVDERALPVGVRLLVDLAVRSLVRLAPG